LIDPKLNDGYAEWLRSSTIITAKSQAYFPDNLELRSLWTSFVNAAAKFYFLSENTRDRDFLSGQVAALEIGINDLNELATSATGSNLMALSAEDIDTLIAGQAEIEDVNAFFVAYDHLSLQLFAANDTLTEHMLDSHIQGLSTRPCDFLSTVVTLEPGALCL
jgi:hypothetical protein